MTTSKFDYAHLHNYIDLSYVDSFSGHYVLIDSGRGPGKTVAVYKRAVRRFINKGEKFVIIRRYKTEIDAFMQSDEPFPDVIHNTFFKDHDITSKGDRIFIDNEVAGYTAYLNGTGPQKVKSKNFGKVGTILYDEFQPEFGGVFLKNEVDRLSGLITTIVRNNPNYKVFMLANSSSFDNPYYEALGISPKLEGGLSVSKDGNVLWHIVSSDMVNFESAMAMASDEYASMSMSGSYSDLSDNSDIWKIKGVEYTLGTLELSDGKRFGIKYTNERNGAIVYTKQWDGKLYTTEATASINHISIAPFWKRLQAARARGSVYFENNAIRSAIKQTSPYLFNISY